MLLNATIMQVVILHEYTNIFKNKILYLNIFIGLYCIPSTTLSSQQRCGCPTNSTTFDEYHGRCVGRVGSKCIYHGNGTFCQDKAHCAHQDPHHPSIYFHESRCFCDLNYFLGKDGKCKLAAKFGESCSSTDKKCDEVSGLKCVNGTCVCNFGKDQQYFDPKMDKCVSFIGKNCTGFNSCPENARCDGNFVDRILGRVGKRQAPSPFLPSHFSSQNLGKSNRFNIQPQVSSKNHMTKEMQRINNINIYGKCVCDYGFTLTKNGKCLGGYRQACSRLQGCNYEDNLECLDGR